MKEKRETVQMLVNVRLRYDTPRARREALAAVREHLGVCYSSAGDGWFHVESCRVQLAPRPKPPSAKVSGAPALK